MHHVSPSPIKLNANHKHTDEDRWDTASNVDIVELI